MNMVFVSRFVNFQWIREDQATMGMGDSLLDLTGMMDARRASSLKPARKVERQTMDDAPQVEEGRRSARAPSFKDPSPAPRRSFNPVASCDFSLNASCSSDASSDSFRSRNSAANLTPPSHRAGSRKKQYRSKLTSAVSDEGSESSSLSSVPSFSKKRCAWVTANTDPRYAAFHDEEWGVPVHDDKKLFELLVLSIALAELSWPIILSRRPIFREVFADYDPRAMSKFNEKKIVASGSIATSLLSELKVRAIIENARQICKVEDECGSFDRYIWSFVNYNPMVGRHRYPRQIPAKSSKADAISKDLVRRGFRGVGPTVIYSFMQAAGMTNDHLVSCFRFQDCVDEAEKKKEHVLN